MASKLRASIAAGLVAGLASAGIAVSGWSAPGAAVNTPPVRTSLEVTNVRVLDGGRTITAKVTWGAALILFPGSKDRFNLRVVTNGAGSPQILHSSSSATVKSLRQVVTIHLSSTQAAQLRQAGAAVLSISQQYDNPTDNDAYFEHNYVVTTHLSSGSRHPASAGINCELRSLAPHAGARNCDLYGASLADADLASANFEKANLAQAMLTGANLTGARMQGAGLAGADLAKADLTGARLKNADFTRAVLNKTSLDFVTATGTRFNRASLLSADLTDSDITGAHLNRASLRGATVTGTSGAICSYTTWTDGTVVAKTSKGATCPPGPAS